MGFARIAAAGVLLVLFSAGLIQGRQWTDRQGRVIEAQYIRLDGEIVVLQQGLKPLRVPLASLSDEDQEYVRKRRGGKLPATTGTPAQPAAPALNLPAGEANPLVPRTLQAERIWTDDQGRTITARFERMVGTTIVQLNVGGRSTPVPVSKLSAADQQFLRDQGALPLAAAGGLNFPAPPGAPALPGLPPAPSFPLPERIPARYPATVGGPAIDGPRWWNGDTVLTFARLRTVDWRGIELCRVENQFWMRLQLPDLADTDRRYVLDLLRRAGQEPLAAKLADLHRSSRFPGAADLSEAERTANPPRSFFREDFTTVHGTLARVTERGIEVEAAGEQYSNIRLAEIFEGDLKYLLELLQRHQAPALLAAYGEQAARLAQPQVRSGEIARVASPLRRWTLNGHEVECQAEWFGQQGIDLRDAAGTPYRIAYKDLTDDDARHLLEFSATNDRLQSVKTFLMSRRPGTAPLAGGANAAAPTDIGATPFFPGLRPGGNNPPVAPNLPPPPQPNFPPQPAPPLPAAPVASSEGEFVGICSNCNREVPAHIGAGEKCPHCGITFDYVENADGTKTYSTAHYIGGFVAAAVAIISLLVRFGAFNQR